MSTKISKTLASEIAFKISNKLRDDKRKPIEQTIEQILLKAIHKQLHPDLKEAWANENVKPYIASSQRVRVSCGALVNYDAFVLNFDYPTMDYYKKFFEVSHADYVKLLDLRGELKKISNDYQKLNSEIESALLSLKTHEKIRAEFPEAADLLPTKQEEKMVVAIQINELREKLK